MEDNDYVTNDYEDNEIDEDREKELPKSPINKYTYGQLLKITKEYTSGDIVIQPNSKTFGRSAYLCYNQECINNAFKKTKINRALRTNASINKEMLLDLVQHTNK